MSSNANGLTTPLAPVQPLAEPVNRSASRPKRPVSIRVRGVGKEYRIGRGGETHSTLAEAVLHRFKNPARRITTESFWALRDLDFDIEEGDVVGVIGRNGAGKSTLLKVLSQITEPTTGRAELFGRTGSLLEVGTGFHPELTGRENIFLNGAILGMTRREIVSAFDQIVEFSGVEQFLDTPVKRYSSGMYVRLAFAVAAHLSSEILIVDEVLAVGDAEFQRKCLGKMQDVAKSGRTVLFVSHHMQSVSVLCNRAMYLEKGRLKHLGGVNEAIALYVDSYRRALDNNSNPDARPGSGELRLTRVATTKETFSCGEAKIWEFEVERRRPYSGKFFVSAEIYDASGFKILQCDSRLVGQWFDAADCVRGRFSLQTPWLKPGSYRVDFFVCAAGILDRWEQACPLEVIPLLPYPSAGNEEATSQGVIFADFGYQAL